MLKSEWWLLCPRLYWLAARPACLRQPSRCRLKPIRLKCWVVCLAPSFRITKRPVICRQRFGKIDWLQPIAANPAQCSLCLFFLPSYVRSVLHTFPYSGFLSLFAAPFHHPQSYTLAIPAALEILLVHLSSTPSAGSAPFCLPSSIRKFGFCGV